MAQASRTLPPAYKPRGTIDLSKNRTAAISLSIASTVLLLLFGWFALVLVAALRPDAGSFTVQGAELVLLLAVVVVLTAAMIILHEAIHGLFFWLFTRDRPIFALKAFYAYAAAPDWYIPRSQYLIVALAPLLLITLAGLGLLLVVPAAAIPALMFVVVVNAAGAVGDMAVVGWLLVQPRPTLVHDRGDAVTIYQLAS